MSDIRRYGPIDAAVRAAAVRQGLALMGKGWKRTAAAEVIAPGIGVHPNTVSNWLKSAQDQCPAETVGALQDQVRRLTDELNAARGLVRELTGEHHLDASEGLR